MICITALDQMCREFKQALIAPTLAKAGERKLRTCWQQSVHPKSGLEAP
jgi:hypothetical protein